MDIVSTNVYQYIAENRPQEAQDLISRYGYSIENVNNTDDLAECLTQLIANEGEQPLYDLADMHPDSHLILESYQNRLQPETMSSGAAGCNCGNCKGKSATEAYIESAQQATNNNNNNSSFLTNQSGLLLIGGLLIITLALIATKN